MRFLVARTATFRDRDAWGEGVDVQDEVQLVHSRPAKLPKPLQPLEMRWHQFWFCLKLLWLSRHYDAVAVGRYGVLLPILQRCLGQASRVVLTEIEWPDAGTGLVNRMAGNAASFLCCFTRAEIDRYSEHFRISRDKFRFVPLAFQLSDVDSLVPCDGGYIFAGGNQSRDWETFLRAMDGLSYPSRVFAKMGQPHSVPPNVMLGSASRSEYHAQMASASCVIVPLLREPLRITGITAWTNAMAMGKVVIVTGRDGTSDYLEHGVSGFCVDYGDVEGLRHYVRLVMQDPELRKRVGAAARERAWRDFCPDVFRRRVLNLLQEACGHDPHISSPLYDE